MADTEVIAFRIHLYDKVSEVTAPQDSRWYPTEGFRKGGYSFIKYCKQTHDAYNYGFTVTIEVLDENGRVITPPFSLPMDEEVVNDRNRDVKEVKDLLIRGLDGMRVPSFRRPLKMRFLTPIIVAGIIIFLFCADQAQAASWKNGGGLLKSCRVCKWPTPFGYQDVLYCRGELLFLEPDKGVHLDIRSHGKNRLYGVVLRNLVISTPFAHVPPLRVDAGHQQIVILDGVRIITSAGSLHNKPGVVIIDFHGSSQHESQIKNCSFHINNVTIY